MNKLGFYIENTTVRFLRDALRQVKPPVILIHAQDRGLLHDIRRELSPDSFIIARLYKENSMQDAWLDSDDPGQRGREFAEEILRYDFGLAEETGANGRLLIDAWMSLNETLRGPASFPGFNVDDQYVRRAEAYDRFQVAFRERLQREGIEAVAFNFAAGNYIKPEHYLDWFPRTLESYTYLGFHEYGWPALKPGSGVHTAALFYRTCMEGIRARYGEQHKAIVTELGLTMAYGSASNPDRGWLNPEEPLSEADYWHSLFWYNSEIVKDDYMLGGCLFQVGHAGRWESFRHLGEDNEGNAILLISRIQGLDVVSPQPPPPGDTEPQPPPPPDQSLDGRVGELVVETNAAAQLLHELPESAEAVRRQLTATSPNAERSRTTALLASNLRTRLDQIQATLTDLRQNEGVLPEDLAKLEETAESLSAQLAALEPEIAGMDAAGNQVRAIGEPFTARAQEVQQMAPVAAELDLLHQQALALQADLPAAAPLAQPSLQDLRNRLPQHPFKRFHTRDIDDIKRIVIHHTGASQQASPEAIANVQLIRRDVPGITYHFLVQGDGTTYWTQPFETVVQASLNHDVNADSIAVALAGDFSDVAPDPVQLAAAADLIAWLLTEFDLDIEAVVGRSEVETVTSPGRQWRQDANYRATLLELVEERLRRD